jgi:hypothetical protein
MGISKVSNLSQSRRGQTMMEYIILVALLAVASIPVAKLLGDVFRNHVMRSANAIVNGGSQERHYTDRGNAMLRQGERKVERNMSDFDE